MWMCLNKYCAVVLTIDFPIQKVYQFPVSCMDNGWIGKKSAWAMLSSWLLQYFWNLVLIFSFAMYLFLYWFLECKRATWLYWVPVQLEWKPSLIMTWWMTKAENLSNYLPLHEELSSLNLLTVTFCPAKSTQRVIINKCLSSIYQRLEMTGKNYIIIAIQF